MTTIDELSNELLINILEHLADHIPRPIGDLVALSSTSRRFRIAAEPFLYHTYEGHRYTLGNPNQHLFAETLVEQPTLSKHVRKLDLTLQHVTEDRSMTAARAVATTKLQTLSKS